MKKIILLMLLFLNMFAFDLSTKNAQDNIKMHFILHGKEDIFKSQLEKSLSDKDFKAFQTLTKDKNYKNINDFIDDLSKHAIPLLKKDHVIVSLFIYEFMDTYFYKYENLNNKGLVKKLLDIDKAAHETLINNKFCLGYVKRLDFYLNKEINIKKSFELADEGLAICKISENPNFKAKFLYDQYRLMYAKSFHSVKRVK